jgi:hypothetical protein
MRSFIVGLILALSALVGHAAPYEKSIDVAFPDELGGLSFVGRHEFPIKELGVNLAYERDLLRGSVFIYDANVRSIPDGIDNEVVRKHFATVIDEVKQLQTLGKVAAVNFVDPGPRTSRFPGCGPQFLSREYRMVLQEGLTLASFTYLTAVRGQFVKLRISYKLGSPHDSKDVEHFVVELRKLLGQCPA